MDNRLTNKKIAILGADSLLARKVLQNLHELGVDEHEILTISDKKSVLYGEKRVDCRQIENMGDFNPDVVINCMNSTQTKEKINLIWDQKAKIIDLSGAFNLDNKVPLMVGWGKNELLESKLISSPSSVALAVATVLNQLKLSHPSNLFIVSFESVSNHGDAAIDGLLEEEKQSFFSPEVNPIIFSDVAMHHNIRPDVSLDEAETALDADYSLKIELIRLLKQIFDISVCRTQVPVTIGDSVYIEVHATNLDEKRIQSILEDGDKIGFSSDARYRCPVACRYEKNIYVGRLRFDNNKVSMWCSWDNTEILAENAVCIAERCGLLK